MRLWGISGERQQRYFWWNMAEVFPGKRFLPLNVGENSASYPSSLKKHWFIGSISRNWKKAFPFLAIPVADWKKKKTYWRPHKLEVILINLRSLVCSARITILSLFLGLCATFASNRGTETLCLFSIAKGHLYLPPPLLFYFSHWTVCVSWPAVPSVKGSIEIQNSGEDLSPSVRK